MSPSPEVGVVVDLRRVRRNVEEIHRLTGVPIIAVIKADAYGLGAAQIAPAISNLVDSFCVFRPSEATDIRLWERTGKPALAIGPPLWANPDDYLAAHVRPAISTEPQARALRAARPVLSVDTGQQRFACRPADVARVLVAGACDEAFTHATTLDQVGVLQDAAGGKVSRMHAAGTSLLNEPRASLDAVRPGLALYRGATRVTTRLAEVRDGTGPAGYSGFVVPHHGVILCGYFNGLRPGPCLINGRPSRILEVGMQSAFVETEPTDKVGDEVVLLGDGLDEQQIAAQWGTTPHEVLVRLSGSGMRTYLG